MKPAAFIAALILPFHLVAQTPESSRPASPLRFIDTTFENASPLWWDFSEDGVVQLHFVYDHERDAPNRANGHFHFQLQAAPGSKFTIEFKNLQNIYNGRPGSVAKELKAVVISKDGVEWESAATRFLPGERVLLDVEMPGPRLFVARVEPYRISDLEKLLGSIRDHPRAGIEVIGRTVEGRDLEIVRIGDPNAPFRVFVRARAHPWEAGSNWVAEGLMKRLLRDDAIAKECLETYCLYVLPMANKDGVARGRTRFNLNGKDLNRDWENPADPELAPENHALEVWLRRMIEQGKAPSVALELHNDGNGNFHLNTPPEDELEGYLDRMKRFEELLREHAWFAERATRNLHGTGTMPNGLHRRFGIEGALHEFNCQWSERLGRTPLARDWIQYGEGLAIVLREYLKEMGTP